MSKLEDLKIPAPDSVDFKVGDQVCMKSDKKKKKLEVNSLRAGIAYCGKSNVAIPAYWLKKI